MTLRLIFPLPIFHFATSRVVESFYFGSYFLLMIGHFPLFQGVLIFTYIYIFSKFWRGTHHSQLGDVSMEEMVDQSEVIDTRSGLLVPDPDWDPLGEIFVENEFNKNPSTPSIRGCPKKNPGNQLNYCFPIISR